MVIYNTIKTQISFELYLNLLPQTTLVSLKNYCHFALAQFKEDPNLTSGLHLFLLFINSSNLLFLCPVNACVYIFELVMLVY